jgi:hypothetical protein
VYSCYRNNFKPVPRDLHVCHTCDNPGCVNPWHLFLGTDKDNALDKIQKGRQPRGEDSPRSKLTEDQVREILSLKTNERGLATRVANTFGVSRRTVGFIWSGATWKHLREDG